MKLLNSAMMPREGLYVMKRISFEEFKAVLKASYERDSIDSYIGYQQNIDLINKWTGIKLETNRDQTVLEDTDSFLVMKLKYRVSDPNSKGAKVNENSF